MFDRFDRKRKYGSAASLESVKKYKYGEICLKAIRQNRKLNITYVDRHGEKTTRTVELKKIYNFKGRVYFDAYCHFDKDERSFRVGRVESASLAGKTL